MGNFYVGHVYPPNIHVGGSQVQHIYSGNVMVWQHTTTTTTTTTIAPLDFSINYSCSNGSGIITVSNFINGSGVYQVNDSPHTSISNAFSGTFSDAISPVNYNNVTNGTWYIVVRDKNNTSNGTYHSITVNCTTTTTTTTTQPPAGAGYYDCGYGCQYYAYNPGCTPCNPTTSYYGYKVNVYVCDTCTLVESNRLVEDDNDFLLINRFYSDSVTGSVYKIVETGSPLGGLRSNMVGDPKTSCSLVLCI